MQANPRPHKPRPPVGLSCLPTILDTLGRQLPYLVLFVFPAMSWEHSQESTDPGLLGTTEIPDSIYAEVCFLLPGQPVQPGHRLCARVSASQFVY